MFTVVFNDLKNFLRNHFLASLVISIAYFVFTKILIEDAFTASFSLSIQRFYYLNNLVVNSCLFSVIISCTFLVVLYFEQHRKADSNTFFTELKENIGKFVFSGVFAWAILWLIIYISFFLGGLFPSDDIIMATIRSGILILGLVLALKAMILFFPMVYYIKNKTIPQMFRLSVKKSSWRLVAYYLIFVILLQLGGVIIFYILDILYLLKVMNIDIGAFLQAYIHVIIMLVQISLYKNIYKID